MSKLKKSQLERTERLRSISSLLVETVPFTEATDIIRRTYNNWHTRAEGTCAFVVGESGAGKTTVADDFLAMTARDLGTEYVAETSPDAHGRWGLIKETENGFIRPVLKVFAAPTATRKGLLFDLLFALGIRAKKNSTETDLMALARRHLMAQQVKLLIFDETHHINDGHKKATAGEAAGLLKMLLIQPRVQIVCLGLPHTVEILTATEQLGRRCIAQYEIPPFRDNVHVPEGDFMHFCRALERALPFDRKSGLDQPGMALRLHGAGAGYVGRIVHITLTAAELAIDRGLPRVSAALLGEAYRDITTKQKNSTQITDDINPFLIEEFRPDQFAVIRARLEAQNADSTRQRGQKTPAPEFTK